MVDRKEKYRLHWRELRGGRHAIQWRDVTGVRAKIVQAATDAADRSTDGTVRIMWRHSDGAGSRAVVASIAELEAWTARQRLPAAATMGDWSTTVSRRQTRVTNFRRLQKLLRGFEEEGLLETRQAADIARQISLALDGGGTFPRRRSCV